MEDIALMSSAASRQKSCNACVRAKRRCDKRSPVCSRCAEKQSPCVYQRRPGGRDTLRALLDVSGTSLDTSLGSQSANWLLGGPADLDWAEDGAFNIDMSTLLASTTSPNAATADMWNFPPHNQESIESPDRGSPETDATFCDADYAKMNDMCEQFQPWQLYDPNTKVHYVYNAQKNFHADFAKKNQTPFLHRALYQDHMPECVLNCLSICCMYVNITEQNKVSVFRALQQNTGQLLGAGGLAVLATTPMERLARTQSLFLYQTIRLFDGDITLRSQAEHDMPLLESWADDLCKVRENLGDLPDINTQSVRDNPPSSWQRWVFAESVRRTIILVYCFISTYRLLTAPDEDTPIGPWAFSNRWTMSRHLWEAPTSFDFYHVWGKKPQYVIQNFDMAAFLELGTADDVDDMGRMMLSAYMGLDELREFLQGGRTAVTKLA